MLSQLQFTGMEEVNMDYVMMFITIALIIAVIAIVLVSWKLSNMIVRPNVANPDQCYLEEIEKGKIDKEKYEHTYKRKDFTLTSEFGYQLSCSFIPRREDVSFDNQRERVVVIVHGYTFCQFGSVKYIDIFRNLGFNCVIYDHRNHGYSDRTTTTMGYYEARDLKQICDWAREKLGEGTIVGTHGESMGAATVMVNASLDDKLAFVIEDCGYHNLPELLAYHLKMTYHLPRFPFLYTASLMSKLRGGIFFHQVMPSKEVAKCESIPMLFLHGELDDFVPTYMIKEAYNAKKGYRRMKLFANAAHAESYWSNQSEYRKEIEEFLKDTKII